MTEPLDGTLHAALLDAAPDAIVAVDATGTIVFVNAQAECLFGYPRTELVGRSIERLIPESVRGIHPGHRARYLADPKKRPMASGMVLSGRRGDGSEFPAEVSLSTIETAAGPVVAAAVRDVTDRKREEAKFRSLLEAAPDAIIGVDRAGLIALVNGQAELLFGYERGELIGRSVDMLVPDAVRAAHPTLRRGYFAEPVTRPMGAGTELAGRRKDGTEFPAEISLSSIETAEGLLVSAAVRDGTDRRQAAIISSSNDAFISKSLDGTITSWNPGATRMYGYEASQAVGSNIRMLVPPELRDEERAVLARAANGERVTEYETVRLRADGASIDVAWAVSPIYDWQGAITGVSTVGRDITDRNRAARARRELEDRLNQSQRLESLGQLAGGIAHDFNNLLAVILNYATFVSEEISDNHNARADVEQIKIAAERAAGLTRQLLMFGRRETVQPELLDINDVVRNVHTLLSRTIGEHVELRVLATPDLPAVSADRGQLEQVLINLSVNARDAMPDGGVLTIETDVDVVDDESIALRPGLAVGRYLTVGVSDSGTGMNPEVIARAFEPFFTTKARGEGTGLGLATVYGIVTEAGGTVVLYSEGGFGTTVRVYLPAVNRSDAPDTAPTPTVLPQGAGEVILVVEDEPAMREVALRILRRNGYQVLDAGSGTEALSILETETCQLLLTDVVMPNMSGAELAQMVREQLPGLPVLFMSGYSQGLLGLQRALDDSVALLQKPFGERALVEKVHAVLAGTARS